MAHPILPPGSTRSSSSFLFALLCGRSSSPPMAREHSLVATCRSWRVAIRLEGRRGSLQKSLTRQSCERFLQRSSPSLKWVWSDMIKYPLYVNIEPGPLDKGPEPAVNWLKIVERTGERLRFPHGLTDYESSSFPGLASEQDWSSESHAASDTVEGHSRSEATLLPGKGRFDEILWNRLG